jgi:hypothetical protein
MNTLQTSAIGFAATLFLGSLAASSTKADPVIRQIDENTVSITDFSGKPPFRRRTVKIDDLSVAEFARFEELSSEVAVDSSRIGETVTVVDFRGKPPFRRSVVQIDEANVAEFARFEEVPDAQDRPRRRGAPGKNFPVRR